MSRILTLVCFCMLTASCASTNNNSLISTETPANNVNRLVDVSMGESLDLEGTNWTVERTYTAASGRICKRLRSASGEMRVGCKQPNKDWYLRKPLMGGTSAPMPIPAAVNIPQPSAQHSLEEIKVGAVAVSESVDLGDIKDAVVMDEASIAAESLTVRENENLWRFSKRVTGNALNWEKIAAFNQLDNAGTISAGQTLRVPTELVVSGAGN